jgi:hypothetical protein
LYIQLLEDQKSGDCRLSQCRAPLRIPRYCRAHRLDSAGERLRRKKWAKRLARAEQDVAQEPLTVVKNIGNFMLYCLHQQ